MASNPYNPDIHHRRSIRLLGYDYTQAGAYFITICVQNRENLFGAIRNGKMQPNAAGEMVGRWYDELANKFPGLLCDEFVCMPNHVHFVLINQESDIRGVVQWFKTMSTNAYIRAIKEHGWPPLAGRLWQRNYWEHIIRDETELDQIRQYIQENPVRWQTDKLFSP